MNQSEIDKRFDQLKMYMEYFVHNKSITLKIYQFDNTFNVMSFDNFVDKRDNNGEYHINRFARVISKNPILNALKEDTPEERKKHILSTYSWLYLDEDGNLKPKEYKE